jgi:hypothetical protein
MGGINHSVLSRYFFDQLLTNKIERMLTMGSAQACKRSVLSIGQHKIVRIGACDGMCQ